MALTYRGQLNRPLTSTEIDANFAHFTGSHSITGSLTISGSSIITGSVSSTEGFTGSLLGTSSWAQSASNAINAQTASFLPVNTYQVTSSWAQSSSQALTASYITLAQTASFVLNAQTASYVLQAVSASVASTASFLPVGTYQITSSWAQSASNAVNAQTASFLPIGTYNITSSWATRALTSSRAILVTQSTVPVGAGVEGELIPVNNGGAYFLYMYIGGAWRSSSFA
jgi:hypothetical protein